MSKQFLIISCSLNPKSRSRVLAKYAYEQFRLKNPDVEWIDLAQLQLPQCDGGPCYTDPKVQELVEKVRSAKGIILATPVYNYNTSASAKNLIELTADAWNNKVVGFISAAGGKSSYMAPLSLINSLMLDFRCLIVPRFVQALSAEIPDDADPAEPITKRIEELNKTLIDLTKKVTD